MRASGYDRVTADWYVEPASCVDALLAAEPLTGTSLDPSCGGGNIPKTLHRHGMDCLASDIIDRGYGEVGNFFDRTEMVDNIITNPSSSSRPRCPAPGFPGLTTECREGRRSVMTLINHSG